MSYQEALDHMLQFEGGYANDPDDRGGETFRGVSRKNWPKWAGWKLIDQAKAAGCRSARSINAKFAHDGNMAQLVSEFYRKHFWEPFQPLKAGDRITAKLFDTSVNMGVRRAVKFLQNIVRTPDDGAIGPKTCEAFWEAVSSASDERAFLVTFCDAQARFYKGIIRRTPSQGKYRKGWLRRAAWLPK